MSYLLDYFCCGNEYICDLSQLNIVGVDVTFCFWEILLGLFK